MDFSQGEVLAVRAGDVANCARVQADREGEMKLLGQFDIQRRPRPNPVRVGSLLILYALIAVFLAGCAMLVAAALGAQEKAVTDKPRLESFHALPLYGQDGGLSSLRVTAIFRVMMLMPDGKEMRPHLRSIEFDLVQHAGQSVIISHATGKEIVELADFGADMMGVSDFMWGLNNPSPLPTNPAPIVRRKTMREKK